MYKLAVLTPILAETCYVRVVHVEYGKKGMCIRGETDSHR